MERRYSVGELAEAAGVSRRTVRYYVQEGLLSPPVGLGRGAYYRGEHLEKLVAIRSMQERGMSLEAIHRALRGEGEKAEAPLPVTGAEHRSLWVRVELLPGVELHVAAGRRLPGPGKLAELAEWCRRYIATEPNHEEANDAERE